jgi:hypothetical protein
MKYCGILKYFLCPIKAILQVLSNPAVLVLLDRDFNTGQIIFNNASTAEFDITLHIPLIGIKEH